MNAFRLAASDVDRFVADGYLIVEGLFSAAETDLIGRVARVDARLNERAVDRTDAEGGQSRLSLTYELGDDLFSVIARCRRVVETTGGLLGGEVYHYHHKMMMKEPHGGGAWEWHQDYGYWYNGAFLYPHLASCMLAVDRATRENGCLQVLRGSHLLGRLNHGPIGDQTGADLDHVGEAEARLEKVYCELAPGDGLFFHSNLLHRSDSNHSDDPRWAFICCYTRADNLPYRESHRAQCRPVDLAADAEVAAVAERELLAATETQQRAAP